MALATLAAEITMASSSVASSKSEFQRPAAHDAIAFLKQEHRQLAEWFEAYDAAGSNIRKQELASCICDALWAHVAIEEEVFFPALSEAVGGSVHHEAVLRDHTDARRLIEQIGTSSPVDEMFDSRIRLLADVFSQCVDEEEGAGGIFAEAVESDMDLEAVGAALQDRARSRGPGNR